MINNTSLFLIGMALGLIVAGGGGLAEYALHLRHNRSTPGNSPGCLLLTIGGLVLAGIAAFFVSIFVARSFVPALVMGAGVLLGFYGGFAVMAGLWFLFMRDETADTAPLPDSEGKTTDYTDFTDLDAPSDPQGPTNI